MKSRIGLATIGLALGVATAGLVWNFRSAAPGSSESGAPPGTKLSDEGLPREPDAGSRELPQLPSTGRTELTGPSANTIERQRRIRDALAVRGATPKEQLDANRLLAAGFTKERVEWISERLRQRLAEQSEYWRRSKESGQPVNRDLVQSYMVDPDLDLMQDMGEEEYLSYRRALGRPEGIAVTEVEPGSKVESGGLRPGDQIISYAGKRVFNEYMLKGLITETAHDAYITLDVLREGKMTQVLVPAGPLLGVRTVSPLDAVLRAAEALGRAEGAKILAD